MPGRSERIFGAMAAIILIAFAIGVLIMNGVGVYQVVRQIDAGARWISAPGRIVSSEVVRRVHKGRASYTPRVVYEFTHQGRSYSGREIEVGLFGSAAESVESLARDRFPVGRAVTVYFDPRDPSDSALSAGVGRGSLVFLFALFPMNAVLGYFARVVLRGWRARSDRVAAYILDDDGRIVRFRLTSFSAFDAGLLGVGVGGFAGATAVGMGLNVGSAAGNAWTTWLLLAAGFAGVLVLAATVALWRASVLASGRYDLVIDRPLRQLVLPRLRSEMSGPIVPFAQIDRFVLRKDPNRSKNRRATVRLDLHRQDMPPRTLAVWLTRPDGKAIAERLASEVGGRCAVASGLESDDED